MFNDSAVKHYISMYHITAEGGLLSSYWSQTLWQSGKYYSGYWSCSKAEQFAKSVTAAQSDALLAIEQAPLCNYGLLQAPTFLVDYTQFLLWFIYFLKK